MRTQWAYILRTVVDPREGGEWYYSVTEDGTPLPKPEAEEWKCPYHNARMCLRLLEAEWPEDA
jgi:mannobiose 2-epimerase